MSGLAKILPHYTYEDYCQWEGRWELIEGIPFAMSPTPVPQHQFIAGNLFREFSLALKNKKCNCKSYLPLDYVINRDIVIQPDVLIVCGEIKNKYLDFPPVLVVEILSPATAVKDRNNKFFIYESEHIPYYIIVDIDKPEIEIYHLKDGKYLQEKFSSLNPFTFNLSEGCFIDVVLNNIWE
jgi:Uma2 family endonuclease